MPATIDRVKNYRLWLGNTRGISPMSDRMWPGTATIVMKDYIGNTQTIYPGQFTWLPISGSWSYAYQQIYATFYPGEYSIVIDDTEYRTWRIYSLSYQMAVKTAYSCAIPNFSLLTMFDMDTGEYVYHANGEYIETLYVADATKTIEHIFNPEAPLRFY